MSSIDSRIVQMQFDNSQFEKGVSQSLKTLELLKKNLQFDEYERQLKGLQQSGDSFSLLKMANSIEEVSQKFSALGVIGKRVLENLTDKAVDAGVKMVKSLSIDQINAGFSRYADKTQAVQTIMAATGEDIGVISEELNRLAMYTDETSYNFVDMVSNIGKFTSMGVDLKTSVTAMQGISNWAAISGQHAAEAGRAMYNLSQALGMGAVKLMDWKSIENANMGTKEFKETAIETAKALGVLTKAGKTAKGTEVTFQNFRETLNQGWFTNEVLLETLKVYGEYGEEVMRVMAEEGISCAEAMKKVGVNTGTLGERAFRAAQEAVTFRQAIEATTDAVSTKWSMVFENIFGNYEEAKVTWTNLANDLYEVFVEPLNGINDVLSEWKNDPMIQGRTKLIEGLHDAMQALLGIIQAIGDGISNIFPPVTAERLGQISEKIREIGIELKRVFAPKTFTRVHFEKVFENLDPLGELKDKLKRGTKGGDVKELQRRLNKLGAGLAEDGIFGPKTEAALNKFKEEYGLAIDGIYDEATRKNLWDAIGEEGNKVEALKAVEEQIEKYPAGYKTLVGVFTGLAAVVKVVLSVFKFLGKVIGAVLSVLSPIANAVFILGNAFLSAANAISEYLSSGELFNGWLEKINGLIAPVKEEIQSFCDTILEFFGLKPEGNELNVEKGINGVGESAKKSKRPVSGFTHMLNKFRVMVAKTGVVEKLSNSFKTLKTRFKILKGPLKGLWKDFKTYLGKGLSAIFAAIPGILASVTTGFLSFANTIIDKVINPLVAKLPGFIGKIRDFFKQLDPKFEGERSGLAKFFVGIGSGLKSAYESVKTWVGEKWNGIVESVTGLIEQLSPDYEGERSSLARWLIDFGSDLSAAWTVINEYVGEKWKSIIEGLTTLRAQLDPNYDEEANGERSGIAKFILSVRDGLREAWVSIKTWVGAKWKSIKDGISNLYTQLDPNYDESVSGERSGIAKFILGLRDSLRKAWVSIKTWVGAKWKSIKDGISNLYTQLDPNYDESVSGERSGIAKFILSVRDGLRKAWVSIKTWVGAKWKSIKDGISNLYTQLDPNYDEEANGERSGIAKFILGVANGLEEAYNKISEWVGDKWTDIKNWFETEGPSIASSISSFANDFWVAVGVLFSGTGSGENGEAGNNLESVVLKIRSFLTNLVDALAILLTENPVGDTGLTTDFQKKLLGIRKFISQVFQAIMLLVTGDSDKYGLELDDGIRDTILQISGWLKGILDAIKGLFGGGESADGIEGEIEQKKSMIESTGDLLFGSKGLVTSIEEVEKESSTGLSLGAKLGIGGGAGLLGIGMLLNKVTGVLKDVATIRGGEDYARNSTPILLQIGKALVGLAAAVGAIALAVVAFATIDPGKLEDGIAAVTMIMEKIMWLIGELGAFGLGDTVAGGLLSKFTGGDSGSLSALNGIAQALIGVGVAIGGIVLAIMLLPDGKEFFAGMKKVDAILKALSDFIKDMPPLAWISGANFDFSGLLGFAAAIAVLSIVTAQLGKLKVSDHFTLGISRIKMVIKALTSAMDEMAIMLFGGAAANAAVGIWGKGKSGKVKAAIGGFIGFAAAVAALSVVAAQLAKIDTDSWSTGFGRLEQIAGIVVGIPAVLEGISLLVNALSKMDVSFGEGAGVMAKGGGYAAIGVAVVGAIVGLAGALSELLSTEDLSFVDVLEKGGDTLGKLSSAIGKFVGGFVGGFKEVQPNEVESFADSLSAIVSAFSTGFNFGDEGTTSNLESAKTMFTSILEFLDAAASSELEQGDFDKLMETKGLIEKNTENVKLFGEALSAFREGVDGIASSTIDADSEKAMEKVRALSTFLSDLATENKNIETNKSAFVEWFKGDTVVGTVLSNVQEFGEKVGASASGISGIGAEGSTFTADLEAALTAVRSISALLIQFGDGGTFDISKNGMTFVEENFTAAMDKLVLMASSMKDYSKEVGDADFSTLASFTTVISNLKNILSGTGDTAINTDNFLKDLDASKVAQKLTEFVSSVGESVTSNTETLANYTSQFNSSGSGLVDAMAGGMSSNTGASNAAGDLATAAANAAKGKTNAFQVVGNQLSAGLARGISQGRSKVVNAAAEVVAAAIARAKTKAEISSPSRVMMDVGKFFTLGFANGITKYGKAATKSSENMVDSSINTVSGMFSSLSSLADDNIDVQPTIAPVVDMTNIRSASGYMNGVFADRSFGVRTSLMASSIATSAGTATKAGQFGSPDVVSAINDMSSRIGVLGEQIANLKMVVDTGALIGQIAGPMDAKLGTMATAKGRMG